MKYLFQNHSFNTVQIPDHTGKMIIFTRGQRIVLDEYFKRYVPKYLSIVRAVDEKELSKMTVVNSVNAIKKIKVKSVVNKVEIQATSTYNKIGKSVVKENVKIGGASAVVGRVGHLGRKVATEFSVAKIKEDVISISNNIGVGILSYNRLKSLVGLINSIRKFTDLTRTTVFVSDESTNPEVWEWLKNQHDLIVMTNPRIGIAGNTNRLLRCLERFKYKLLLNDDVEVLANGWDQFYFDKMIQTNIKHFCYRQVGIYNATAVRPNNLGVITINSRPHGAVMAIHDDAFKKVGFMDESFGIYGCEHVDYSDRISRTGLAPAGYHDISGSDSYFKIYDDKSSDENKSEHFRQARALYNDIKDNKSRVYISASNKSAVPSVSYVIPFRDIGRAECIETVIQNVRAQKYPSIQIILAEQDDKEVMSKNKLPCIDYIFSRNNRQNLPFNKSQAFNDGVSLAKNDVLILHDADMLVRGDYTMIMSKILSDHESAHIGSTVCYMTKESTDKIISIYKINEDNIESDRTVSYYEGGSLAIKKDIYKKVGGFCEQFVGYGVEDCDFFWKIKSATKLFNERSVHLFHLWHARTNGWHECHTKNKQIGLNRVASGVNNAIINDVEAYNRKYK